MKKDNTPPRITHPVPAETLAAYHEGRLSPEEEHALEMAALDDPFLADALEGIDMLSPEELQADLVALGSRMEGLIAEEENDVKVIAMVPWWRRPLSIAAVVALLISAISLAILLPANQDTELAVATEALENETRALEVKEEPTGDSPEGTAVPKQLDKTDLSTTIATNEQSTNQIRARERADSEVQPSAPVEKSEEVFLTEIAMVEAEPAPELPAEPEFGEAVTEEALVEDLVFESNLDEAFAESEAMDLAEEELDPLATGAGGQVNRGMALADSSILEETESYSYAEAEPEAERDAVPEMADQPARSTTRNSGRLFSGRRKQQAEEATEAAPPAILQEEARYGNAFADDDDVDQGLVS
ncbi:MAG TPA: hypothetical protein DCP28_21755, partial [Cytophagales bacterium]|nr:hypothetical protein [Cytophagales bacterium]